MYRVFGMAPLCVSSDDGIFVSLFGHIDFPVLQEIKSSVWEKPAFANHLFQLWDFSGVSSYALSETETRLIAYMDNPAYSRTRCGKRAVVSGCPGIVSAINIYQEAFSSQSIRIGCFPSIADACAWLDLDVDRVRQILSGPAD